MSRPRPIRTRREFQALSRSRERGRAPALWVVHAEHPDGERPAAVAFAIGRKAGPAVVRNRIRRRLRALMADRVDERTGLFLIGATPDTADLDFRALGEQLDQALEALR